MSPIKGKQSDDPDPTMGTAQCLEMNSFPVRFPFTPHYVFQCNIIFETNVRESAISFAPNASIQSLELFSLGQGSWELRNSRLQLELERN